MDQSPSRKLTEEETALFHRMCWEQGYLEYLLHPDLQRRVYRFTHDWKKRFPDSAKPIIWDLHRAAGKTYELALIGIEDGMRTPGREIRFGAATVTQADEIVEPNVRKILAHLPEGFAAIRHVDKGGPYYELWNPTWAPGSLPSRFWIIGCRERADNHRGKRSHVILLDECRDIDAFEYCAKVVFGPHFATMERPLYVMSSTPPESMDHAFHRIFCLQAMEDGRYICGPSTEDKDWSAIDDERMLELFHSKESPEWKREMLCMHISDPTRLVIPEFDEKVHVAERWERPSHFFPLVVADGGYVDYFACLFGYVDFNAAKLIIEDSVIARRQNTGEIAKLIKAKREELYGEPYVDEGGSPQVRYVMTPRMHADMKPNELADLDQIYKLTFLPAETHDVDAQINVLRDYIARGQVVILEKNKALIRQLKNAIRNEKGKLTHSEEWGHWDAVMALTYMAHVAPWRVRPFPKDVFSDFYTKQFRRGRPSTVAQGIARAFMRGQLRKRFKHGD